MSKNETEKKEQSSKSDLQDSLNLLKALRALKALKMLMTVLWPYTGRWLRNQYTPLLIFQDRIAENDFR